VKLAQRLTGLDAELFDKHPPGVGEDSQRVCLTAAAVQGEHELSAQPLAQGMTLDERLDLGDQCRVASACEISVDALLDRRAAQLRQALDLVGERLVR
jgi:hypothetical protein